MTDATNPASLLAQGVDLERAGAWQEAFDFYLTAQDQAPGDARFSMRRCGAAIRLSDPTAAAQALMAARAIDAQGPLAEKLDQLEERIAQLRVTQDRILGVQAFEAGDFATAAHHLDALAAAVPDHPWAHAKARIAAGLAPGFAQRLQAEQPHVSARVFLSGCGRSGTWLLMAMLQGIEGMQTAPGEQPFGAFLDLPNDEAIHLVKRQHNAYLHFDKIPQGVKVIHVIRHPFDVLMSAHRGTAHHITLDRLEGEHSAYFQHLADRPDTCVVRFEDMVHTPDAVQSRIEAFLGVKSSRRFEDFYKHADLGDEIVEAMHGLRPLDKTSLHRWRGDREAEGFLRQKVANSTGVLTRFAQAFDYDLDL
jgi:tetratricopeptide (TPR) repeat protein